MKTLIREIFQVLALIFVLGWIFVAAAQSDTRVNKLIELFEDDQPAFGLLSFDYSLNNARSMASSGLDFILIDMEHAPFDVERLRLFLLGMDQQAVDHGERQFAAGRDAPCAHSRGLAAQRN